MEMLVVLAIIGVVLAVPFFSTLSERKSTTLDSGQASVISALKVARSKALSGVDGTSHGVRVEADKVIVFPGDTYVVGAGVPYPLPAGVTASIAGSADIVFTRLQGTTVSNTITITSHGDTRTVNVSDYGNIE